MNLVDKELSKIESDKNNYTQKTIFEIHRFVGVVHENRGGVKWTPHDNNGRHRVWIIKYKAINMKMIRGFLVNIDDTLNWIDM